MVTELAMKRMLDALELLDSINSGAPAAHLAGAIDSLSEYMAEQEAPLIWRARSRPSDNEAADLQ